MGDYFIYHGSPKKLIGNKLIPKKATDLGNRKENLHTGVYATDIKEVAIAMAIISSKGVICSSLKNNKPYGIIYDGWTEQRNIYLYSLSKKNFKNTPPNKHQYVSETPIKPVKIEVLKIKDYLNLIRKATKDEKEKFDKKYNMKLK